ncbi:MAG: GntR family transcriptional regulator [Gammaproteobacteria bacterium]
MPSQPREPLAKPSAAAPKYSALASTLIEDIRAGRYRPGDLLPSEPELSRRFGVSRHTVRAALRSLYEKGLIVSRRGHGSVVQATAVDPRYNYACNSIEELLQYAATPRQVLGTERVVAGDTLAAWLGCEPGYAWWSIHTCRWREAGGPVIASSRIYVPDAFGDAVAELADSALPLFSLTEKHYGVHVAQIRQGFSVSAATAAEAADLGLASGAAVMCVERRFFDERGGLIEVSRSVHPPETFHYEMTLRQVIGR